MPRLLRQTLSVLGLVTITALAVYALVDLVTVADPSQAVAAQAATTNSAGGGATQTCPVSGCTATSCHATDPNAPGPNNPTGSGSQSQSGSNGSSGQSGSGTQSDSGSQSGVTMTCPATGCTANYCHHAQGGSSGNSGRRHRTRSVPAPSSGGGNGTL